MNPTNSSGTVDSGTPSLSQNEHQDVNQPVDEIIQKHAENVINALNRSQKNRCVPISHLPNELIAAVFLWVKEIVEQEAGVIYDDQNRVSPLAWITVSHVSSGWRAVALDLAQLWTTIPLWCSRWAKEMLIRSKRAPLRIIYDFRKYRYSFKLLQQALGCPEVLKSLYIRNIPAKEELIPAKIEELIPTGLTQLETLVLNGIRSLDYNDHFLLPANTLSGAEKLIQLDLSACRVNWITYLPSTVTTLKLTYVHTPLPFSRLIEALEGLPLLEILILNNAIESFEIDDSSLRRVKLHRIQQLSTVSSLDKALVFYRYITFSPDISLSVDIQNARILSTFAVNFRELCSSISKLYAGWSSDASFTELSMQGVWKSDYGAESFSISLSGWPGVNKSTSLTMDFTILRRENDLYDCDDFVEEIFNSGLPIQDVTVLSLDNMQNMASNIAIDPSFLAQALSHRLLNVTHINVDSTSFGIAMDALRYTQAESAEKLCFPKLSTLQINRLSIDFVHAQLYNCLSLRYKSNQGITKLILNECNYISDSASSFREFVEDVVCHKRQV